MCSVIQATHVWFKWEGQKFKKFIDINRLQKFVNTIYQKPSVWILMERVFYIRQVVNNLDNYQNFLKL